MGIPGREAGTRETLKECLIRECQEELGVTIQVGKVFAEARHTYGDKEMSFTFFESWIIEGELEKRVHQDIRWVRTEELGQYAFCPADVEVAERLAKGPI